MTTIVCMALSAAALVIAILSAVGGRFRGALRWAALAMIPAGLYLTGLITVFDRIGHTFGDWGAHLVFDPKVWTGVGMLGAGVLVLLLTTLVRGSGASSGSAKQPRAAKASGPAAPVGGSTLPAVTAKQPKQPKQAKQQSAADDLGDFSDVEEILKRRGL
jgi:hypothetical protein